MLVTCRPASCRFVTKAAIFPFVIMSRVEFASGANRVRFLIPFL